MNSVACHLFLQRNGGGGGSVGGNNKNELFQIYGSVQK